MPDFPLGAPPRSLVIMFLNLGAFFNMSEEGKHKNWHQQEWIELLPGRTKNLILEPLMLMLGHPAIPVGDRDGGHLNVHVFYSLDQLAAINLTNFWLIIGLIYRVK